MNWHSFLRKLGVYPGLSLPERSPEAHVGFYADEAGDFSLVANKEGWRWLAAVCAAASEQYDDFVLGRLDAGNIAGPLAEDSGNVVLVNKTLAEQLQEKE